MNNKNNKQKKIGNESFNNDEYGNTGCRFLHKNQHTQRKLLNFEFWINGELSKIGHHVTPRLKTPQPILLP